MRRLASPLLGLALALSIVAPAAATTAPGAPVLTATTNPRTCFFGFCSGGGVRLSWTVPDGQVTGYVVERLSPGTLLQWPLQSQTTFLDTYQIQHGATYSYAVLACAGVAPALVCSHSNTASAEAG